MDLLAMRERIHRSGLGMREVVKDEPSAARSRPCTVRGWATERFPKTTPFYTPDSASPFFSALFPP